MPWTNNWHVHLLKGQGRLDKGLQTETLYRYVDKGVVWGRFTVSTSLHDHVRRGTNGPLWQEQPSFRRIEALLRKHHGDGKGQIGREITLKNRRKGELRKIDLRKLHRISYSILTPNRAPKTKCWNRGALREKAPLAWPLWQKTVARTLRTYSRR